MCAAASSLLLVHSQQIPILSHGSNKNDLPQHLATANQPQPTVTPGNINYIKRAFEAQIPIAVTN
jgi:hypothetical protein